MQVGMLLWKEDNFFSSYKPRGIKVKLQQEGPTQNWHFYFLQLAKVESMCISQCFSMDVPMWE